MADHGGRRAGAGRPVGGVSAPRRAIRALAAENSLLAMEALIGILKRAKAADAGRKGAAVDRPRDADIIAAAVSILDRAYGRPGPDRSFHGFVGAYNLDKLNGEQTRQLATLLRLAAPEETDRSAVMVPAAGASAGASNQRGWGRPAERGWIDSRSRRLGVDHRDRDLRATAGLRQRHRPCSAWAGSSPSVLGRAQRIRSPVEERALFICADLPLTRISSGGSRRRAAAPDRGGWDRR
jgi:hypothetical protein